MRCIYENHAKLPAVFEGEPTRVDPMKLITSKSRPDMHDNQSLATTTFFAATTMCSPGQVKGGGSISGSKWRA